MTMKARVFGGLAFGLVAAVAMYAVMRVVQYGQGNAPDPAAVTWSIHAGFFWRALTSLYAGGFVALVVYVASARRPARWPHALGPVMLVAAALLTLQALVVP
jgi:hypothetical protein